MLPPFTPDGLLPVGDYPLTLDELRASILVRGPENDPIEHWDTPWRSRLVDNAEVLIDQLWSVVNKIIMIRTDAEYRRALENLKQDAEAVEAQKARLEEMGLKADEVRRALEPMLSFHEQLKEEVDTYERMKRGDLGTLHQLTEVGRWLIGIRIVRGMSQRDLADRLGVTEAQVSRDENNEYRGITVERAQRIFEAMGLRFRAEVEEPVAPGSEPDIEYA